MTDKTVKELVDDLSIMFKKENLFLEFLVYCKTDNLLCKYELFDDFLNELKQTKEWKEEFEPKLLASNIQNYFYKDLKEWFNSKKENKIENVSKQIDDEDNNLVKESEIDKDWWKGKQFGIVRARDVIPGMIMDALANGREVPEHWYKFLK